MRVEFVVDGYPLQISTRNPDLLARWLTEVFSAIRWTPATDVRASVWPGFVDRNGQPPEPDWIADTRVISYQTPVASPEEFVKMLQKQIEMYRGLAR